MFAKLRELWIVVERTEEREAKNTKNNY